MRGLKVVIAGAGLAAALPGMVAAHTDLPVIGVPLQSRTSVAGGLDAMLAIAQMPPGVPVACVGVDSAKNAAVLAARILVRVIGRYTRPEMGAVWSEQRKLRQLAGGGAGGDRRAGRARAWCPPRTPRPSARAPRSRSRRSRSARRSPTTTWPRSWTWWPPRSARPGAGCTTGSPRPTCWTRRPGCRSRRPGRSWWPASARFRDALARRAREHVDTLCVGRTHGVHAEPTTFGVKLAGFALEAQRNLERLRARGGRRLGRRAVGRGRAPTPPTAPSWRRWCWSAWAWSARTCRPRWWRATATPSC